MNLYYSIMLFEPVDGNTKCRFTMQYRDDPGGMIPTAAVNWATSVAFPAFMDSCRVNCLGLKQWEEANPELAKRCMGALR